MGTASLVFGLILIGAGIYIISDLLNYRYDEESALLTFLFGVALIPVPLFVIGGLLLRKFDRDRKKEKIEK